jgi:predicted DNA-binding protein (MmcQ/YjbR family)
VNPDELRAYGLAKPGAWPDQPWDGDYVAKVADKIFAFFGTSTLGVKCGANRDEADEWLSRFPGAATPMRYLARSGWNSLTLTGAIDDDDLRDAVDVSYDLVVARLPRSKRPAP